MKLYLIGGLGADERVFSFINFGFKTQNIQWIKPEPKEELNDYAKRLCTQIKDGEEIGFLGVSFGGIVAIEMAKIISPKILILISSVETHKQLPKLLVLFAKTGVLKWIPSTLVKPPAFVMNYMFSAENKTLLKNIVNDTDPAFIRWALIKMGSWKNTDLPLETLRIHGTNDRLIPLKGEALSIAKGGHFMIVDRAEEVSEIIKGKLVT